VRADVSHRNLKHSSRWITLVFAAALGCGADTAEGTVADAGPASAEAAHFSDFYPLIFPSVTPGRCDFCHGMPPNNVSNGLLSSGTTPEAAYAALMAGPSKSKACGGMAMIVPGKPEESLFYLKLLGTPPCGSRMPLGGAALPEAQIAMVRSWILAGAKDD
jgi:hypothetical protein